MYDRKISFAYTQKKNGLYRKHAGIVNRKKITLESKNISREGVPY